MWVGTSCVCAVVYGPRGTTMTCGAFPLGVQPGGNARGMAEASFASCGMLGCFGHANDYWQIWFGDEFAC